ncbi:MAG: DNA primase [Erysipelotrichaceae bacterium]
MKEEEINDVRAHSDIVDIISRYVPLTHKGKNYWCACPFHDDHNPSLSINPDKQIFKCFVCGAGGNVFTFVQKFEHISFVESVYKVAEYAGIHLEHEMILSSVPIDPKKAPLYKAIQDMIEFTHYELQSQAGKPIKDYLIKRGLNDALIDKFELGYNPEQDAVYKFLHAKKHDDQHLIEANLVRSSMSGLKDVFANRITIPIHDAYGNPVGFSARRIIENDDAKYINTGETMIYTKGNLIYNYHRAKPEIKKHKKVFLVEGAMDVIAFGKADIYHALATLGTACTKEQLKLLKALNVPLVLCYDGDRAGRDATYKFGKAAREQRLNFEIVENKRGLDPDDIIELYGKKELQTMSEKTISWVEFLFDYLSEKYNLENYTQKKEFAQELGNEINLNVDPFEKQNYYLRLKELTGFDMSISQTIPSQEATKSNHVQRQNYLRIPKMGEFHAQQEILSQMLLGIVASNYFKDELGFLPDETCNKLAIYIIDYYRNHKTIQVADLIDFINEEKVKSLLLQIANWELGRDEIDMEVLGGAITKVKSCLLDRKIAKFNETIAKTKDPIEKAKLADEKNRLILEKRGMLYEED